MKFKIVKAGLDNLDELVNISRITFVESFAWYNTEENMQLYLTNDLGEDNLKAELEDEDVAFLLLKEGNAVAGYIKINYNSSRPELEEFSVIEIERIYILKSHHRKGLGKILLQHAIDTATKSFCDYIWLAVWELNTNAIDFYKSQGFEIFGKKKFRLGEDIQNDICMKLDLKKK